MVYHSGEWAMEDSSQQQQQQQHPSVNLNGQIAVSGGTNNRNDDVCNQRPSQYSIPGILHYIQHEWAKFELERSQWEVHRAELEAKITFLQGERKCQDNLKNDLVRRIKMLEYALTQERSKYHKLKYGTELNTAEILATFEEPADNLELVTDMDTKFIPCSNISWKQGRSLLRQYLQEIGYSDTIVDVRSHKVKEMLGIPSYSPPPIKDGNVVVNNVFGMNGDSKKNDVKIQDCQKSNRFYKKNIEVMAMDTEAAIMANFEFLTGEADVDMDEDDEEEEDEDENILMNDDMDDNELIANAKFNQNNKNMMCDLSQLYASGDQVVKELNLLSESDDNALADIRSQSCNMFRVVPTSPSTPADEDLVDPGLGLGELAELTVNNESDVNYESNSSKEPYRKTWNAKYTLRSHFDGVRALAFHPVEPVLITASEDRSLKLWNLHKTVTAKKSASLDVEPLYTFRKHLSPVLCVIVSATGEECYSGCLDGSIYCWSVPSANIDPYDSYAESGVLACKLEGHTDAIWSLSLRTQKLQLLSCSADCTVKLWSPAATKSPLISSYGSDEADGIPTCADFIRDDMNRIVVSYVSGNCAVFDLETGKQLFKFETPSDASNVQVNRLVCHPTIPLTITAHEDRNIRFFDCSTGKMVHWMVAHLDAVTSLAIDPSGLFLLSGSHDCSIRFWNLDTKTCVQEITAHRKKFDESIHDVAFHPSRPYIASSGADGLAKVFVC